MIGYVRGKVSDIFNDHCFVDVNGVGYRVFIASNTRQNLRIDQEITLYTYLQVREDAMLLFGFSTHQEYQLFQSLISVSGIGPKVAIAILSTVSPSAFCQAVATKNISVLTNVPGIGKKTAERLILELKDKLGNMPLGIGIGIESKLTETNDFSGGLVEEAIGALAALGYSSAEITPILNTVYKDGQTLEELIKLALKEAGRR